jgi:hypothetical protein
MTDADLDLGYSALAQALAEAGPDGAALMLSMVCLGLMASMERADDVLPLIAQARARFAAGVDPSHSSAEFGV